MLRIASRTFAALAHRNYRRFAIGGVISNVGTWMQRIAQDWLVLQLTDNSGFALGLTTALQLLPTLLLSPFAGVVADRFDKRRLLQATAVALAVPAGVLGLLGVTGVVEAWHVYVIAFVFGIGSAFDIPGRQAFISELVPASLLTNAVSLNSLSQNLARMIGPAVAGVLISALGSGARASSWVILINAVSYVAVIWTLQVLDLGALTTPARVKRGKGQIREGVRYVRSRPDVLLVMTVVFFAGTFGMNFQVTSALMATDVYGKGAGDFGMIGTTLAIGSFLGALIAASRGRTSQRILVGSATAFGISVVIAGAMPGFVGFVILTPFVGFFSLTLITSCNTTVQLAVDSQFRGRVMALYMMVLMGGTPVGAPVAGWIAEQFGPRWSMYVGGTLVVFGVVLALALFARPVREMATAEPVVASP